MTYKSHEDIRDEYIAKMGPECGAAFHVLFNELLRLRSNWREYVELFGTNEARIGILNESAPRFFHMLQGELFENVLLHLCRMTDPPRSGGRRTVSVRGVVRMLPVQMQTELADLVDDAEKKTEAARDWRNSRIAHHDLERTLADVPPADASRKLVGDAMEAFHDALASIHGRFFSDELWRDPPVTNADGAESLLYVIRSGLRRLRERKAAFIRGDFDRPDEDFEPL